MINLIAPINPLGYGVVGTNVLRALSDITEVALWPIGPVEITTQEDANAFNQAKKNAEMPNFNAPCLRIWHQHDMSQFVGHGQHIGFPIFELDQFNAMEKHHLDYPDRLFVCSQWAKDVIMSDIPKRKFFDGYSKRDNVYVVPLGVNTDIFQPDQHSNLGNKTVFFNCGKWEVRKGHDVLAKAFESAFPSSPDVELWMMPHNPFNTDEENQNWHKKYLDPRITILPRVQTQKEVYNIMQRADCGVFPSRAEGWNLEALEMLAIGKEVIITNYSAHTEFCNSENCHLINITETELAFDDKWFHGQGSWAKLGDKQISTLIDLMRSIHEKKQNGSLGVNEEGINTARKFTWNNTANRIVKCLNG